MLFAKTDYFVLTEIFTTTIVILIPILSLILGACHFRQKCFPYCQTYYLASSSFLSLSKKHFFYFFVDIKIRLTLLYLAKVQCTLKSFSLLRIGIAVVAVALAILIILITIKPFPNASNVI